MKTSKPTSNFGHKDKQPWYKNYMVVIFVIGLPLFVVVTCLWFVYYSIQIGDTVVRDDWYMDGKTLYQDLSRDELAHDLDIKGEMLFDDNNQITFILNYPSHSLATGKLNDGTPVYYPDELRLSISHATEKEKDRDTVLIHVNDNKYKATLQLDDLESKYYVEVSNEGKLNWRLKNVGKLPQSKISFEPLAIFDK